MIKILEDRPCCDRPDVNSGYRGYANSADRNRAIAQLRKQGNNYFVKYVDVQSRYALSFSWSGFVPANSVCIC